MHSVSMGIWVNAGARDESDAENGLSHFIEHMIFKGTPTRSAYDIARAFDAIGGYSNAFTSMETTCFHARVMDSHLDIMTDILSDIFLNSLFAQEEIDRERPVILQEIGMVEDTPEEYAHLMAGRTFWGDHPLGRSILGTRENLVRYDTPLLHQFFRSAYTPSRTVVAAAGRIDHNSLVDRIAPRFLKPGADPPLNRPPLPRPGSRIDLHPKNLEQAHVCITAPGLPITDDRRYVLNMLHTMLGGNMSSRLFQTIREQRGLAYSVYSFVSSFSDAGMFGVYAAVDPDNVAESIDLILRELHRIQKETPGTEDLSTAREYLKGNLLLSSESNDSQMVRLAQGEIYFGRYTPIEEIWNAIDAVTAEDIRSLAGDLFQQHQLSLTLLGPEPDSSAVTGFFPANP
jgi:predicted Zn-dependent peptidase